MGRRLDAAVNNELMPFAWMTYPAWASPITAADIKAGELLFQSWLLAFGAIPFDRHSVVLMEVVNGEGFVVGHHGCRGAGG